MRHQNTWFGLYVFVVLPWFAVTLIPRPALADSSDDKNSGTTETYYWQGNQLNNLNRLGSSADFEEEQRHAREGKDADSYLATIRAQMQRQAAADAKNGNTLVFQGLLPGNPIELTYVPPGVRVTLHLDALFDENSSSAKVGVIDTLARLRTILQSQGQKPVQLVLSDTMDDGPAVKGLDAERSLFVLSMLSFPAKGAGQEDLTPEKLSP